MKLSKPSLLFESKHLDHAGGGTHSRQIIYLLSEFFTVYCEKNIFNESEKYNEDIPKFNVCEQDIQNPDIYVTVDHSGKVKPKGKINIVISFYPSNKKPKGFDYAICANDFVKRAIDQKWGMKSLIIPPFRNPKLYKIGEKNNSCIAIGNFFLDSDGFSKNQHLLIDWYIKNKATLNLIEFKLFGFPNNPNYVDFCKRLIKNHPDITIHTDAPRTQIRDSLAKSKYLLHAHGYGRKKSDQVEHFGIIAVESLLSGTLPIVHQSGGCSEIAGTKSFKEFSDINRIIEENISSEHELRSLGKAYSFEEIRALIPKVVDQLSTTPIKQNNIFRRIFKYDNN